MSESRFSRRTIIAAVEVVEGIYTNAAILTRFFLRLGPDVASKCDPGSLKDRCNHLIKFIDEDPARHSSDGEPLQEAIVKEAISLIPSYEHGLRASTPQPRDVFLHALDGDGLAVREGALIQALPVDLELPQAEDDVTRLLIKHGLTTSKGHLDQAFTAHGRGDWAAANSQIRTFYESFFDEIIVKLDPATSSLSAGETRRAKLAAMGFLQVSLNEWSNDGKNFVNGLFKRLHPAGSHPGLSDQEDSTFRRHVVLLAARLFLLRLDNWPSFP